LVDVLGGAEVHAFAVSSNISDGSPFTSRGWSSAVVSPEDWNVGYSFLVGNNTVSTSSLGSYSSRFGTDAVAVLFSRNDGDLQITEDDDQDEADWSTIPFGTAEFLYGDAIILSEFVALDSSGQVLDHSLAAIPKGRAWLMLGVVAMGTTAVSFARRKWLRRSQASRLSHS
jgi:hypothetical protein